MPHYNNNIVFANSSILCVSSKNIVVVAAAAAAVVFTLFCIRRFEQCSCPVNPVGNSFHKQKFPHDSLLLYVCRYRYVLRRIIVRNYCEIKCVIKLYAVKYRAKNTSAPDATGR